MRSVFLSAGHSNKPGRDRGAQGNGYIEGELAVEFRNILKNELEILGIKPILDKDDSILSESVAFFKNKTQSNSIVIDIHWNAATPTATGTETLIPSNDSEIERSLAKEISDCISTTLGIPLRGSYKGLKGVRSEAESHHGRLGWMRLNGENVLLEVCFITNKSDMDKYQANKHTLIKRIAKIIYDKCMDKPSTPIIERSKYTVQRGDSLSKISVNFGVSIDDIKKWNSLKSDTIQIGQVLIVSK